MEKKLCPAKQTESCSVYFCEAVKSIEAGNCTYCGLLAEFTFVNIDKNMPKALTEEILEPNETINL